MVDFPSASRVAPSLRLFAGFILWRNLLFELRHSLVLLRLLLQAQFHQLSRLLLTLPRLRTDHFRPPLKHTWTSRPTHCTLITPNNQTHSLLTLQIQQNTPFLSTQVPTRPQVTVLHAVSASSCDRSSERPERNNNRRSKYSLLRLLSA